MSVILKKPSIDRELALTKLIEEANRAAVVLKVKVATVTLKTY